MNGIEITLDPIRPRKIKIKLGSRTHWFDGEDEGDIYLYRALVRSVYIHAYKHIVQKLEERTEELEDF